jgi:hypothetical protein
MVFIQMEVKHSWEKRTNESPRRHYVTPLANHSNLWEEGEKKHRRRKMCNNGGMKRYIVFQIVAKKRVLGG